MAQLVTSRERMLERIDRHMNYQKALKRMLSHSDFIGDPDTGQLDGDFMDLPEGIHWEFATSEWSITMYARVDQGVTVDKADLFEVMRVCGKHFLACYHAVMSLSPETSKESFEDFDQSFRDANWDFSLSGGSWQVQKFMSTLGDHKERLYFSFVVMGVEKANCVLRRVTKEIEVFESVCEGDPNYDEALATAQANEAAKIAEEEAGS